MKHSNAVIVLRALEKGCIVVLDKQRYAMSTDNKLCWVAAEEYQQGRIADISFNGFLALCEKLTPADLVGIAAAAALIKE